MNHDVYSYNSVIVWQRKITDEGVKERTVVTNGAVTAVKLYNSNKLGKVEVKRIKTDVM